MSKELIRKANNKLLLVESAGYGEESSFAKSKIKRGVVICRAFVVLQFNKEEEVK